VRVVFELLAERIRQPREAPHRHPHCEVRTLNVRRADVLGIGVHKTLRMSPAMAAGIETRLWSMEDVVRPIERHEDLRSGALTVG